MHKRGKEIAWWSLGDYPFPFTRMGNHLVAVRGFPSRCRIDMESLSGRQAIKTSSLSRMGNHLAIVRGFPCKIDLESPGGRQTISIPLERKGNHLMDFRGSSYILKEERKSFGSC